MGNHLNCLYELAARIPDVVELSTPINASAKGIAGTGLRLETEALLHHRLNHGTPLQQKWAAIMLGARKHPAYPDYLPGKP